MRIEPLYYSDNSSAHLLSRSFGGRVCVRGALRGLGSLDELQISGSQISSAFEDGNDASTSKYSQDLTITKIENYEWELGQYADVRR